MPSLVTFLSVAAGGAIGASARYAVSILFSAGTRFPWPTLLVNVLGCFIAGLLVAGVLHKFPAGSSAQLFLLTGLLGGFTTFSAFSVETLRLAEAGQPGLAGINVLVNVLGSLLAAGCGWWLARTIPV